MGSRAKVLLETGCIDILARAHRTGWTALHSAVHLCLPNLVRVLLLHPFTSPIHQPHADETARSVALVRARLLINSTTEADWPVSGAASSTLRIPVSAYLKADSPDSTVPFDDRSASGPVSALSSSFPPPPAQSSTSKVDSLLTSAAASAGTLISLNSSAAGAKSDGLEEYEASDLSDSVAGRKTALEMSFAQSLANPCPESLATLHALLEAADMLDRVEHELVADCSGTGTGTDTGSGEATGFGAPETPGDGDGGVGTRLSTSDSTHSGASRLCRMTMDGDRAPDTVLHRAVLAGW
ncbi:unnamed protein product [Protopolystoma xenopodis]|uniref:Uncharacterized protein n=1 Tax=Protopolystoma xenopodis TaxID=117903 RepID=A0A3S5AX97_9PLAT|nr:unnamed protein product [Protopolystoma xenopodis]